MIVVDASAVVHVLINEPVDQTLVSALRATELHAPTLLDYEVASALRGHAIGRRLGAERLAEALHDLRAFQVVRHSMRHLIQQMLDLRSNFTAHDAAYVVLAQALGAELVTSDVKLASASRFGVDVQVFGSP